MNVIFEGAARALLLAHGVLGFTAVFAGTHHAAHADLERSAPFVVQLFDFKEHLSALALALVLVAALAGRSSTEASPQARWSIAALSCIGAAFLWSAALIGLYVTARHPV